MFTTYVIQSDRNKTYIGQTIDLTTRLKRHNKELSNKKNSYTYKNGHSWKVIYKEEFLTRQEAIYREKELKSHQGRESINKIINGGVCRTA